MGSTSNIINRYVEKQAAVCEEKGRISKDLFVEYGVKQGLRDEKGKGVLTGLTNISQITAFKNIDGDRVACDGELLYRGYDVKTLAEQGLKNRFIFEEAAYLLIFGELPDKAQLEEFKVMLSDLRELPTNFTRDVIMKSPTADIMNSMTRSVLTLASYDDTTDVLTTANVLRQCMQLISIMSRLAVYGYHAYNHYINDESMYIHNPLPELSTAENFLRMLRPDKKYTELEARVLDVALLLHMEHGGGNNSTFTTRVVTSSGSDTYSAIAAALSSLKGKKHGGANIMVMNMMDDIRAHVKDYSDKDEIAAYLRKILHKEAFDRKGLIYGIGHAVYSKSDPREVIFKKFVDKLAAEKGRGEDLMLYDNIAEIVPAIIEQDRPVMKDVSPNVDFYSGFVYDMLGIPKELYTPLFAVARIAGWSAHRIEELVTTDKIIRPAYKSLVTFRDYEPREERERSGDKIEV